MSHDNNKHVASLNAAEIFDVGQQLGQPMKNSETSHTSARSSTQINWCNFIQHTCSVRISKTFGKLRQKCKGWNLRLHTNNRMICIKCSHMYISKQLDY